MSLIFLIILLLGILLAEKNFADRWSPLFLMSATWCIVITLFMLNLVDYYPISINTWLLLIGSYIAFSVGCITTLFATYNISTAEVSYSQSTSWQLINTKRLRLVFIVLLILSTYANILSITGSIQQINVSDLILGKNSAEFRTLYSESTIGSLQLLNVILIPFAYLLYKKELTKKWKVCAIIAIIVTCIALMLTFSRASLLRSLFFTTVVHHFFVAKLKRRQLSIIGIIALIFFVLILVLRSPYYDLDHRFWVSRGIVRLPQILSFLSTPYVYATSPIVALNEMVERSTQSTYWGQETFGSFQTILYKLGVIDTPYSTIYESYEVGPFSVNVATYLRHFYLDFAYVGCILFPWLIGLISTYLYQMVAKKSLAVLILPYSVLAWNIVLTPFSNHFVLLFTPLTIMDLFLCSWLIVEANHRVRGHSNHRYIKHNHVTNTYRRKTIANMR